MIEDFIGPSSFLAGFIISVISFHMSIRYRNLSLSFVLLGAAFLSYGFAELYWYILDMQSVEPYGSIPDILYGMYYVFALLHIIFTLRALKIKLNLIYILIIINILSYLMAAYIGFSPSTTDTEMFVTGAIFSGLSAALVALSIITIIQIRHTMLMKSWVFIGLAILFASLTDVWYYTQENLTGYEYGEFPLMDLTWFATDILIVIGIILHRKAI